MQTTGHVDKNKLREYAGLFGEPDHMGINLARTQSRYRLGAILCFAVLGGVGAAGGASPSPPEDFEDPKAATPLLELTEANFDAWRDYIRADASELAWTRIPWAASLRDGIIKADASAKPVLLWVMNGHPLGCT